MTRYRAVVEYDGTDFLGFQRQASGRTVQAELEAALTQIGWGGKSVLGAGRTDSGVHALGQVVAFDLDWRHNENQLLKALNGNLPRDIAMKTVGVSADDFHPRYHAKARRYRYTIYNTATRSPLWARYAWQMWYPAFDFEAMQTASQTLIGRHDFASFGTDPEDGLNTTRTISVAEWSLAENGWLYFDVQADAFLYRMVRSLVGALKKVGAGDLSVAEFYALLQARERAQCPPIAPAHGLCLREVIY